MQPPQLLRLQLLHVELEVGAVFVGCNDSPHAGEMLFGQFFDVLAELALLADCHLVDGVVFGLWCFGSCGSFLFLFWRLFEYGCLVHS